MFNQLAQSATDIIDILKVQIMPSTVCVEVNELFTKSLFRFGPKSFQKALDHCEKMG